MIPTIFCRCLNLIGAYLSTLCEAVRWRLAATTLAALLIATAAYGQLSDLPQDSQISVNFLTGRATWQNPDTQTACAGDGWQYRHRTSTTIWASVEVTDAVHQATITALINPDDGEFQLKRLSDACPESDWTSSVGYTATTLSSNPATLRTANLNGATLTVTLGDNETTRTVADGASSPETFASGADSSHFGLSISGLTGVTIDSVSSTTGGRTATLTLSYTGSTASGVIGSIAVTVAAAAHSGTNVITSKAKSVLAPAIDYDPDDNGLIDINSLAQLNAMRWDLDGNGAVVANNAMNYNTAFPNAGTGMGCPNTGCTGYELKANLTFPASGDYSTWSPISNFATTFEGNGNTLTDLNVNLNTNADAGLFGSLGGSAVIRNLGLVNPTVVSSTTVAQSHGIVAGYAPSGDTISAVYILGGSITTRANTSNAGALIGLGTVTIRASYSTASVRVSGNPTDVDIGGLVGHLSGGSITASYAAGAVSGGLGANARIGGLVGQSSGSSTAITDSYCDTGATLQANCIGSQSGATVTAPGKTSTQLQTPTGYTGIYLDWNVDLDGISGNDDPWTFGASDQYPVLKYADMDTTAQFAAQPQGVPQGVTLMAFEDSLVVRWNEVSSATGYKVQWKSGGASYPATDQTGSTRGQATVSGESNTTYTIAMLTNGTPYTVRVLATRSVGGDGDPSAEVLGVPGIRYDSDGDGLIEIETLAQLHAMRWDLDGNGVVADNDSMNYNAAFPTAASGMGCPSNRCTGYELTADLDFDENDDGEITAADATYWNSGNGWVPIGSRTARFNATFDGDGHIIENLFINRNSTADVGLFAATNTSARILALGLVNVSVAGSSTPGALVGHNQGRIAAVYSSGAVQGTDVVGGLVGATNTTSSVIVASYATASVTITGGIGGGAGLVGWNDTGSVIRASYSIGAVTGGNARGGFSRGSGTVAASYWDSERSGIDDDGDTTAPEGRTTLQLQSPTSATGIYADWDSLDVNGNSTADEHPWMFGASDLYPVLKYAGMDTTAQFDAQFAPRGVTLTAFADSLVVRWNAVRNATGYKVQWKSGGQNYPATNQQASTHGQATVSGVTYTIAMLTNGTPYTVRVIATRARGDSDPSAEVMSVPGIRYDSDGNGLIEIETLTQLNAMRWDRNGDGVVALSNTVDYNAAFPTAASGMGCPSTGCTGYELTANLTFPTSGDLSTWSPISNFNTTLEGNGHTLTDLKIASNANADIGLFGSLGGSAVIRNLGLVNPTVVSSTGDARSHGIVAGYAPSGDTISAVYILGGNITTTANASNAGALIGLGTVTIRASYSTASVRVSGNPTGVDIGGLVGDLSGGSITASYATGTVSGGTGSIGGLVGKASGGTITASYCDTIATDQANCIGSGATAPGKSTTQLQTPTGYTGIYTDWNLDLDGISGNDDPWTFGTSDLYPVLKYADMDTTAQFAAQFAPRGVTLTAFADSLVVRWNAVSSATGYKVQWKSGGQSYPATDQQASTHGQATVSSGTDTTYTIAMLTNGTPYTVRVIATWAGGDSDPSAEVLAVPGIRYDSDGDGLIEIETLAQLNAMRWDPNGDGAVADSDALKYNAAFPNAASGMGCPSLNCTGYELTADLDFDENDDDQITAADATYWNGGNGWVPIGSRTTRFNATFDGDGHVIENLFINRSSTADVGLFGATDTSARILALGLVNVSIVGSSTPGALVGHNQGRIAAVYSSGAVQGTDVVGGLVGATNTTSSVIVASYATASVTITGAAGTGAGLAGWNDTGSVIRASYSTGAVTGGTAREGFLRGDRTAVAASYWDSERSGIDDDGDTTAPEGRTTLQLQSPTSATGIYADWDSLDVNGNGTEDEHPWMFGASDLYPVLKYAGMDTTTQFDAQFAPRGVTLTPKLDTLVVRWNAVRNATGYKVQWKSGGESYPVADQQASTHGQATVSSGTTTHTIAMLTNGTSYTVRVIATRARGDSDPSAEVMSVPGIRYDSDGNGLIEIETLAQLHAMRWDRNGDGVVAPSNTMDYNAAFPTAASGMGCPSTGCTGYELTANLTFPASGDLSTWSPISNFNTTLEGNGNTLTDLKIASNANADMGLFGSLGGSAIIRNLGLVNPTVVSSTGDARSHGIVAGYAPSGDTISAVYILGGSITTTANSSNAGALLGLGTVTIRASYSTASVRVSGNPTGVDIGGLVGDLSGGSITASYATGTVSGGTGSIGGLVGKASGGTITASYCDTIATDQANCIGSDAGTTAPSKSTTQLQTPTGYTDIYTDWNLDLDGISGNDDPWTFGTSDQYPVLKYAGMDTTAQFAAQFVPRGVTLMAFEDSLVVRWNAVRNATGYKVQWKSGGESYPVADQQASTHGQATVSVGTDTTYTIANLTNGTSYTVRVIATWAGGDSGPSIEVMGVLRIRYDSDGNGLIDIGTLAQLHAMRWDPNGDGAVAPSNTMNYNAAFPSAAAGMGCPSLNCTGYELMADLDFDENGDDQITAADATYWNGGNGWVPIGPPYTTNYNVDLSRIQSESFNATFEGNGHVIENLYINRSRNWSGLFAALRDTAVVRSLGLPNARVQDGEGSVGVLAGQNSGRVAAVWATGSVQGNTNVGGLVGTNRSGSAIVASYTMASVKCRSSGGGAGGLAASNADTVRASYSTGAVTGACSAANKHGLTGGTGTVIASYWDSERSGIDDDNDADAPEGKTTQELQSLTSATGIYANWDSLDVNGNGTPDEHPWTFGASDQYPVLKYAGMDTTVQFAAQFAPRGVTLTAFADSLVVRWNAVRNATGYKVQWKSDGQSYNTTDRQGTVSSGSDTTYAIAMLTSGTTYAVRVIATWARGDSDPSSEVMGVPGIRYDSDGNGLIEIGTVAQLHAMRWGPRWGWGRRR